MINKVIFSFKKYLSTRDYNGQDELWMSRPHPLPLLGPEKFVQCENKIMPSWGRAGRGVETFCHF